MAINETTFIESRITAAQAALTQVDAAIATVLGGGQSYSLDSGQTRQTVQRGSLESLQKLKEHYENQILVLNRRLCGSATIMQPGW